jgi:hypothetical protein
LHQHSDLCVLFAFVAVILILGKKINAKKWKKAPRTYRC